MKKKRADRSSQKKQRTFTAVHHALFLGAFVVAVLPAAYLAVPGVFTVTYEASVGASSDDEAVKEMQSEAVEHLDTPKPLRAIYMTQCVVGTPSFRDSLVSLIEETELNAVVIDVKDFTGKIGFPTDHPDLAASVSDQCGAWDMRDFIERLHEKGIYTIARITVFQDPHYTRLRPDLAVKKASDGTIWEDYKGLSFIDVGAREFWDYIVALSKETYALGFDELNFDYIRYPSDGPMNDVYYSHSEGVAKAVQLERFFAYLSERLRDESAFPGGKTPVLSADVFGMTTTNTDDLNIGQVLERTLPYFDYVSPMVYPSHYPEGFNGWSNPNNYPYDVVKFSMQSAVERTVSSTTPVQTLQTEPLYNEVEMYDPALQATTSERVFTGLYKKESYDQNALRPWLQDFDYGGNYGVAEVEAQIQATYDSGLHSWMMWDPANRYTRAVFEEENVVE